MPTALIINGAETRKPQAGTRFNATLSQTLHEELEKASYIVLTTKIEDGYEIANEHRKFQRANLIIFQFPIFWFEAPSSLKRYIDDVYTRGVFWEPAEKYGRGGLLTGKRYMLSTTWNAKSSDFGAKTSFLGKRTPDDVLTAFHITQQYVGLQQLPSFFEHDVVHRPDPAGAAQRIRDHIKRHVFRKHLDFDVTV